MCVNSVKQEHHQLDGSLTQNEWQTTLLVIKSHVKGFRTETANVMNRARCFSRQLEDRHVTSLTRKAECDEETVKVIRKKADLVDSIPRCYQSNQCGRGRTVASMRTEEDDLPSGPASQRQDCGSVTHPRRRASGVKGLSKMTTRSRKLGKVRLARLVRYHVGTQKLTLRFDLPDNLGKNGRARQRERSLPRRRPIPNRGIAGVQKAPRILRITTDVNRKSGDLKEEARRSAPGECRDAF